MMIKTYATSFGFIGYTSEIKAKEYATDDEATEILRESEDEENA